MDPSPYLAQMLRYAYRLTKNRAQAEDLVQDACIRALQHQSSDELDKPAVWLMTVVRTTFLDHLRFNRRLRRAAAETPFDEIAEAIYGIGAPPRQDFYVYAREMQRHFGELTPAMRAAINAATLGFDDGIVEAEHLRRARKSLREAGFGERMD